MPMKPAQRQFLASIQILIHLSSQIHLSPFLWILRPSAAAETVQPHFLQNTNIFASNSKVMVTDKAFQGNLS